MGPPRDGVQDEPASSRACARSSPAERPQHPEEEDRVQEGPASGLGRARLGRILGWARLGTEARTGP
eukprot:CAMPEP_0180144958 /NCGR_PEP_ID=MMETSP0986-20121125/17348_1 /TAXON_ID=697907 /ORGANISM="non described non described, Strain CCMP2293" /LENGTH=66 /DNA_ID=CAMNT_0022089171 /DNA_START=406 /DNA_END=604 /DNA_ORIENTATION=-